MTYDIDIDTYEVLNLEEQSYNTGYAEGREKGIKEQYLEGKAFGYQTAFQRYLIVGYILGLARSWEADKEKYSHINGFEKHVKQLSEYVDEIPTGNEEKLVEEFDKRLNKARNKLRVLTTLTKEGWKTNNLDDLIKEVGGQMQVSERDDEMW